jgi:hypothetical protein
MTAVKGIAVVCVRDWSENPFGFEKKQKIATESPTLVVTP